VYLAYLDESETGSKRDSWKVVSAAIIRDDMFGVVEITSSFAIENFMPEERRSQFSEFHACEIYGGHGVFEGIDQQQRFKAIEWLLGLLGSWDVKIAYGAINLEHLSKQPHASANPLDIAFRMCAQGIGEWLDKMALDTLGKEGSATGEQFALLIADECDKADRVTLQNSFRSLRKRLRPPDYDGATLRYVHDDMYFGDSKYSIGIQIADLCSYFIARHLAGDAQTEHFYQIIAPQIISEKHEP
jgi:hypothetical protein